MTPSGPFFEVFTLFPEAVSGFAAAGLLGKALERGVVGLSCTNFRDFATDRHRTVDDAPFGGGPGMVLRLEPVVAAIESVERARGPMHKVLLDPSGRRFDQDMARRFATYRRIGLLCGRYEGFDARLREHYVDECVSLGDFVLNGGEVAALAVMEAVFRLCEGALGNPESAVDESHGRDPAGGLLEAPQYTRPARFRGHDVPAVLRSGDHGAVALWRARKARARTWLARPDLRKQVRLPASTGLYVAVPVDRPGFSADPQVAEVLRAHGVHGLLGFGAQDGTWAQRTAERLGGRPSVSSFRSPAQLRRRMARSLGGELGVVWVPDPWGPWGEGPGASPRPEVRPAQVAGYLADALAAVGVRRPRAVVVVLGGRREDWQDHPGVVPVEPDDPLGLAVAAQIPQACAPHDSGRVLRALLGQIRQAWEP